MGIRLSLLHTNYGPRFAGGRGEMTHSDQTRNMRFFKRLYLAGAVAPSIAIGLSNGAAAQTKSGSIAYKETDEIVVTARSTGETLLEVPVAVTAFTGDQLSNYAASDLSKIAQMAPQIEIYSGGVGAGGAILIRGVGTTADTAGLDMSVSLSADGTQIARPRTVYAGMFDLEQVAILKGPQALFFGRNASAGVVSIQSANPTQELSGYIRGGYEFEARERYVEGAVSIPISDSLAARFAGRFSKMRGWLKNESVGLPVDPFNPFENVALPGPSWKWGPGSRNMGGRVTVKWEPSSNYTSIMKATFLNYQDVGMTSTAEPICDTVPTVYGFSDGRADCKLDGHVVQGRLPVEYAQGPSSISSRAQGGKTYSEMNSTLLTWQQTVNFGKLILQANTGYTDHKFVGRGNYTGTEFVDFYGGPEEKFEAFSQEVRLVSDWYGSFNFTIGGYYEGYKNYQNTSFYLFNVGRDPDTGSYLSAKKEAWDKGSTWSAFGQMRYDLMPNLELAAGVRYSKTKKRVRQGQPNFVHQALDPTFNPNPAVGFIYPEGILVHTNMSEDNWSPEATLTWHPDPDQTLYVAYKTGYKSGGIALPAIFTLADSADSVKFKPEKAKGFEAGYKAQFLNRALKVEAVVYSYKFSGLQLTSWEPLTSSYKILNSADAKQYGIELSASYRLNENFTLRAASAYNHLDYKRFETAPCWTNQLASQGCANATQDLSGRKLHRAPRFSASLGLDYDTDLSEALAFGLSLDARYTSSYFASESFNPISKQDGYVLLNASARLGAVDDSWEFALIGRNLTNERVLGFVQDKSGAVSPGAPEIFAYSSRPREVALQATLRF